MQLHWRWPPESHPSNFVSAAFFQTESPVSNWQSRIDNPALCQHNPCVCMVTCTVTHAAISASDKTLYAHHCSRYRASRAGGFQAVIAGQSQQQQLNATVSSFVRHEVAAWAATLTVPLCKLLLSLQYFGDVPTALVPDTSVFTSHRLYPAVRPH